MELRKEYKELLDLLDEQYKDEIRKETGLIPAPNVCNDTARLYRLIPKYLKLQRQLGKNDER